MWIRSRPIRAIKIIEFALNLNQMLSHNIEQWDATRLKEEKKSEGMALASRRAYITDYNKDKYLVSQSTYPNLRRV